MLVLTRKSHEQIQIGDHITVTILRVKGGAVRIGVDAPRNVTVLRKELQGKPAKKAVVEVEAVVTSEESTSTVAVGVATLRRSTVEGAASFLAGGKTTTLATCPLDNPRRAHRVRTNSPLAGYLPAR